VKDYLIKKSITIDRLQTKGFGTTQPILVENSEENRRLNRKIKFEIINE
jgi:OmpA-OmpF porin, OOP family